MLKPTTDPLCANRIAGEWYYADGGGGDSGSAYGSEHVSADLRDAASSGGEEGQFASNLRALN